MARCVSEATKATIPSSTRRRPVERATAPMCSAWPVENDLLHSWLAERCGLPFSPALWGTAHKRWYPGWEAEESIVFGFQCLINGGELSDWHMLAVTRYIKWVRPKTTLTPLVAEARAWLAQFESD
jgi:hypothetical protein